jgi:hypothetical protein
VDVIDPSNGDGHLTAPQGSDLSVDHPQALSAFEQQGMVAATLFHQCDLDPESDALFVERADVPVYSLSCHLRPPDPGCSYHRGGGPVHDLDRSFRRDADKVYRALSGAFTAT